MRHDATDARRRLVEQVLSGIDALEKAMSAPGHRDTVMIGQRRP